MPETPDNKIIRLRKNSFYAGREVELATLQYLDSGNFELFVSKLKILFQAGYSPDFVRSSIQRVESPYPHEHIKPPIRVVTHEKAPVNYLIIDQALKAAQTVAINLDRSR